MLGFAVGVVVGGISAILIMLYVSVTIRKQEEHKAEEREDWEDSGADYEENRLPKLRKLKLVGNEVHWSFAEENEKDKDNDSK